MTASRVFAVSAFSTLCSTALASDPGSELYDVMFLLDPSGSVSSQWCSEVRGVKAMMRGLPLDGTVAVGVLTFDVEPASPSPQTEVPLTTLDSEATLQDVYSRINGLGGASSNSLNALIRVDDIFLDLDQLNPGSTRFIIMSTDAETNNAAPLQKAYALRQSGVKICTLGIGSGCVQFAGVLKEYANTSDSGPSGPLYPTQPVGVYTCAEVAQDYPAICSDCTGIPHIPSTDMDLNCNGLPDVDEGILFVDQNALPSNPHDGQSWDTAFLEIQDALDVNERCASLIFVADGVYLPRLISGTPRLSTFNFTGHPEVFGGFAGYGEADPFERKPIRHRTILSGDLQGDDAPGFTNRADNCYHVVTLSDISVARLDGLIILGGYADGASEQDRDKGGGAKFLGNALGRCRVQNC